MSKTLRMTEKDEALQRLREWLPKGATVYTVLRHVSRSGMQRHVSLLFPFKSGKELRFGQATTNASTVLGWRCVRSLGGSDALVIGGAGMDMGFHAVYTLAQAMYGDGYALKQEWL